jgi:hypothetical protein
LTQESADGILIFDVTKIPPLINKTIFDATILKSRHALTLFFFEK